MAPFLSFPRAVNTDCGKRSELRLLHQASLRSVSLEAIFIRYLKVKVNNTLFVQCHEQEIPEVIPIEGIPFVNQSKSNQINLTQHKSNQIKFWFLRRGENRSTRRKTSRSRVENQQTQPTYDAESGNRTRATLVGGECSDTAPTLLP